jgi:hypothetical protein
MSTVPGGCDNQALGIASLAGGARSRANHDGTFVWTDQSVVAQFASTAVNQFLIRAAGGVGLGVNNPGFQLDVGNRMRVRQGSNGSAGVWFYQTTPAADRGFVGMQSDNAIGLYGNAGAGWGLVMNVTDGKVGVGTTAPSADLHVSGVENDGTNAAVKITSGAQTMLLDGNEMDAAAGLFINHNTTANVVIGDGGGFVGVNDSTPADKLDVDGNIRITGCLWTGSTVYSGVCASDQRYKKNVEPLAATLDRIAALRPVSFDWRTDEFPEKHFEPGRSVGLIAQETERVMPEIVITDESGYKAVDYGRLPLLAIQAIRELKAENEELRARLAGKTDAQQAEISELREMLMGLQWQMGTQVSKAVSRE